MRLSGRFLSLAILLSVAACDGSSTEPDTSRRYSVRYEVTGTFDSCTFFYITRQDGVTPDQENQGGDSRSEDGSLPWSHAFDVTVTQARPFNVQLGAVCSSAGEGEVTATVIVDGADADEQTRTGQNVNAQAGTTLTLGG